MKLNLANARIYVAAALAGNTLLTEAESGHSKSNDRGHHHETAPLNFFNMTFTERFTRLDENTLERECTVDGATTLEYEYTVDGANAKLVLISNSD